ncbi:MAG: hypothetical protein ABIB79_03905 [archaeon]
MFIAKNHGYELLEKLLISVKDSYLPKDTKERFRKGLYKMIESMEPVFSDKTPILRNLYRIFSASDEHGTISIRSIKNSLRENIVEIYNESLQ